MRKSEIIILLIILLSFALAICLYPKMPSQMASHWSTKGEVDGYLSRFWGLFLMPLVFLILFLLFVFIPQIDPLKENIKKFRKYFDGFIMLIVLFLFYVYLLTLAWNLGWRFDMGKFIIPFLAILFYYCGILLGNAKRNWFIGIRTPWTLSSEEVWNKTHKIGGRLFRFVAPVVFLGVFFKDYAMFFILAPIILVSLYLIAYSYFEYKKLQS